MRSVQPDCNEAWLTQLSPRQLCALAHHIVADWGYAESTYTHISARACAESFYIKQQGDLFQQVTASNLCRINLEGIVVEGDPLAYNHTGHAIHHAIYNARSDVEAVVHLHSPSTVAVSLEPGGLAMLSQWALHFYGNIAYHNYES